MDKICLDIIDVYRDETKTTAFVNVFTPSDDMQFEHITIEELINRYKNTKIKKIYPTNYEQIPYKNIVPYHIAPRFGDNKSNRATYGKLVSRNKTGLFKITFSDNTILLVVRWIEGFGRNETIRHLVVGEYSSYAHYLRAFDIQRRINQKPKAGIYRATMTQFGMNYDEIKELPTSPVIHPKLDELKKDVEYYFNNVKLFTRFKQSGVRKFMLISEPGTGKSSMFYKLASAYGKQKSVVFVTDIQSAAAHLSKCAKHKMSTIIFLEDADSTLGDSRGNSAVLNFLDGVDTPSNPQGAMILMSTNFPERIEERILTRPGRIDKIFNIDALNGHWALECADLYFSDFFDVKKNSEKVEKLVSGMTGAQIKELALASMSFASSSERTIDVSLIEEVKKMFAKNLSEAYKYSEQNSLKQLRKRNAKSIGFTNDEESW